MERIPEFKEHKSRRKISYFLSAAGISAFMFALFFRSDFIRENINSIYYYIICSGRIISVDSLQINNKSGNIIERELSPGENECISVSDYSLDLHFYSNYPIVLLNDSGKKVSNSRKPPSVNYIKPEFPYEIKAFLPRNTQSFLRLSLDVNEKTNRLFQISIYRDEDLEVSKKESSPEGGTINNSAEHDILTSSKNPDDSVESEAQAFDYNLLGTYNVKALPPVKEDEKLSGIVESVVQMVVNKGFSTDSISISLLDLSDECCGYANFSDQKLRYPASVSKLFWGVILASQRYMDELSYMELPKQVEYEMLHNSDNNAASLVVDSLTQTISHRNTLQEEEFISWKDRRHSMNTFFTQANYNPRLNISQKNFPIPDFSLQEPVGTDLQIRGEDASQNPIRNQLNTFDVARLLYELNSGQAVSEFYSENILNQMSHSLDPEVWEQKPYNSIKGFFGEGLPVDTILFTKVGWTTFSRQEAAIIYSPDNSVSYVLVVFGEDAKFSEDESIFPEISKLVFEEMLKISIKK